MFKEDIPKRNVIYTSGRGRSLVQRGRLWVVRLVRVGGLLRDVVPARAHLAGGASVAGVGGVASVGGVRRAGRRGGGGGAARADHR